MPFYNEGKTILDTLTELENVRAISQIVCVDDGSTNNTADVIEESFPSVTLIKFSQNKGKAEALLEGLNKAQNDVVLLIDSDLENVKASEIERGINLFAKHHIDMLIFQVKTTYARIDGFFNRYIIYSGMRIIRRKDLLAVMEKKPKRFQLETAVNKYCIDNKRRVYWIRCSAVNPNKMEKEGFIKGFLENAKIMMTMIAYTGILNQLRQVFFYCRKEIR